MVLVKGAINISWRMLIGIIAAVVVFLVILAFLLGIADPKKIGIFMRDSCALLVPKLGFLGLGAEAIGLCDIFYLG